MVHKLPGMKGLLLLRMVGLPAVLTLASTPLLSVPLSPPPPPPIFSTGEQLLLRWVPGEVRCAGHVVVPVLMQKPNVSTNYTRSSDTQTYHFRIDGAGRILSVVNRKGLSFTAIGDDVGAALTASTFSAGAPQSDCSVEYRSVPTPMEEAPVADLIAYTLIFPQRELPAALWKKIAGVDGDCMAQPRPMPLMRAFPDFDKIASTAGARDWVMVGYDLDAGGRPMGSHIVAGTGNSELDHASMRAVRKSRFVNGPHKGCLSSYWRTPATLPAPVDPDPADLPPTPHCPTGSRWAVPPRLIYPAVYKNRAIEGWARLSYDVAPWGETGNIQVLASEPSAAFGQQAMQMIRSAKKEKSPTGASGCVETVRFVIGKTTPKEPQDEPIILD